MSLSQRVYVRVKCRDLTLMPGMKARRSTYSLIPHHTLHQGIKMHHRHFFPPCCMCTSLQDGLLWFFRRPWSTFAEETLRDDFKAPHLSPRPARNISFPQSASIPLCRCHKHWTAHQHSYRTPSLRLSSSFQLRLDKQMASESHWTTLHFLFEFSAFQRRLSMAILGAFQRHLSSLLPLNQMWFSSMKRGFDLPSEVNCLLRFPPLWTWILKLQHPPVCSPAAYLKSWSSQCPNNLPVKHTSSFNCCRFKWGFIKMNDLL